MRSRSFLQLTALFFVAFNLRIAMACIGPVLDHLRADLDMTRGQLGLLSTLPVLCMSLFAPFAQRLSVARGHEIAILYATLAIAVATLLRAWADAWLMIATALIAGLGIATTGTLLNTFVKTHFPSRTVTVSGLYSASLCLGAALAAGFTAPITQWIGSWRISLALWCIPAFFGVVLWWRMLRRDGVSPAPPATHRATLPWSSGKAWLVTIFFGLQSITFYVVLAWLAPMYVELGWSPERAGALLGYWIALQVIFILIVAPIASRSKDRRPWLIGCSVAAIVAMAGFSVMPDRLSWLWVLLLGFASGGWFPLCMNLPLDYTHTPTETGGWTALMLFGGYLISSGSPSLAGWTRDLGASYSSIFASMSVLCAVVLILSFFLKPPKELLAASN